MKKILVVEDEVAYLRLLHDQLTKAGYQVVEAQDGENGLSMAKSEKPDLILLDVRIPKMDGLAMLDLLRKEPGGKSVKVIILTAFEADDRIVQRVVEAQPSYYLVKGDVKFDELLAKIKEIISE